MVERSGEIGQVAKRGRGGDLTNSPLSPVIHVVALLYLRTRMHEFTLENVCTKVYNKIQLNAIGDEWYGQSSSSNK